MSVPSRSPADMPPRGPGQRPRRPWARLREGWRVLERRVARTSPRLMLVAVTVVSGSAYVSGLSGERSAILAGVLLYSYLVLLGSRVRTRSVAKEINAALLRSESQSRAIIDTAPDAVISVAGDGSIKRCNRAGGSIFGHPVETLPGRSLSLLVPQFQHLSLDTWFAEHGIGNRVIGFEAQGRRVDGTLFPITVSASHADIEGRRFYTFFVRDASDTKWAEQELLLRERALSSTADGVVISDMRQPGSPVIYANRAFEIMTGYDVWEILGRNCSMLQGADTDPDAVQRMREAIAARRPCREVLRNYRKDGTPFWNEVSIAPIAQPDGEVIHFVGVLKDVTQRIASERVLQQRTERLNAVFDLSPDGFLVLDDRDVVSIVNPVFERMTGLSAEELVGRPREALEARLMALCTSREVLESLPMAGDEDESGTDGAARAGQPGKDAEGAAADGGRQAPELLHLHSPMPRTLLRRVRRSSGATHETVMYLRDITHELEVDRMKSEFLSMAAHELRTPMASIFGFAELLLKRRYDDARRLDMLSTIHRQAGLLISLVNELLDLARIEARRGKDFQRRRQALQPIVRDTVAALLMDGDRHGLTLQLPDEPIWIDADEKKLAQALNNVLSNAYKYSPAGGEIVLTVERRLVQGRVECGVRITDQGIGMSAEHLARIFERFFRADTSGNIPGTGLGMTIVKEIVELHGGQVDVQSEIGQGTAVTLWLPTLDPAIASNDAGREAAAA